MSAATHLQIVGDPLVFTSDPYDPDEFYCAVTDKRGHWEQLGIKIPQGQLGHIWSIVNALDQYNSAQDFVRDAIIHHMHRRNEQIGDPELSDHISLSVIQARTAMLKQTMADRQKTVDDMVETLKQASDTRDWQTLAIGCEEAIQTVEILPPPYDAQLAAEVARFREILRHATNTENTGR